MREVLVETLISQADDSNFVFLTGDLGFDALEPLQERLGPRFINAGVAEQNMVSVAAGLAREGMKPWVYSIGPFLFSRAAEQIRNDVGLNNTPVCLVANGAGLLYGVQGPSHFSVDDLGFLSTVPNLETFTPAFDSDVEQIVARQFSQPRPTYLRLGRCESPEFPDSASDSSNIRRILQGKLGILLCFGTVFSDYLGFLQQRPEAQRPDVWVATKVPKSFSEINEDFVEALTNSPYTLVVEEHLEPGGFGMNFSHVLRQSDTIVSRSIDCVGLKSSVLTSYGSQSFLKQSHGLGLKSVMSRFGIES